MAARTPLERLAAFLERLDRPPASDTADFEAKPDTRFTTELPFFDICEAQGAITPLTHAALAHGGVSFLSASLCASNPDLDSVGALPTVHFSVEFETPHAWHVAVVRGSNIRRAEIALSDARATLAVRRRAQMAANNRLYAAVHDRERADEGVAAALAAVARATRDLASYSAPLAAPSPSAAAPEKSSEAAEK